MAQAAAVLRLALRSLRPRRRRRRPRAPGSLRRRTTPPPSAASRGTPTSSARPRWAAARRRLLLTGSYDLTVVLWDVHAAGVGVMTLRHAAPVVALPGGGLVATASGAGTF
ncbi:hypothetical protein AB1Y20_021716 [Prymnesium parvum]|uniref:Peroxin-7 n=1 Tax=Prymnesium parvum TaxID=97485 RepID=A0AB34JM06_PRYPA